MLKKVTIFEYVSRDGNPWLQRDALINLQEITSAIEIPRETPLAEYKMNVTFKNGTKLVVKGVLQSLTILEGTK